MCMTGTPTKLSVEGEHDLGGGVETCRDGERSPVVNSGIKKRIQGRDAAGGDNFWPVQQLGVKMQPEKCSG